MPQFFLNKRLIVLLVSIILLVALIGISLKERNSLTWPEQFVKDTVGVVETCIPKASEIRSWILRKCRGCKAHV